MLRQIGNAPYLAEEPIYRSEWQHERLQQVV